MAKLKIYGVPGSRAARVLWMAEELGLPYENLPVHFMEDAKKPEYLAVNPNGRIPAIDDDGVVVWESMACNLYLARRHGGELAPRDLAEEGGALQWSFWVMTECEKPLLDALVTALGLFGVEKDPERAQSYLEKLERPFDVIDAELGRRDWLMGGRFTVADLNVACVLQWIRLARLDIGRWRNLDAWLTRCLERPAFARTQALGQAS